MASRRNYRSGSAKASSTGCSPPPSGSPRPGPRAPAPPPPRARRDRGHASAAVHRAAKTRARGSRQGPAAEERGGGVSFHMGALAKRGGRITPSLPIDEAQSIRLVTAATFNRLISPARTRQRNSGESG